MAFVGGVSSSRVWANTWMSPNVPVCMYENSIIHVRSKGSCAFKQHMCGCCARMCVPATNASNLWRSALCTHKIHDTQSQHTCAYMGPRVRVNVRDWHAHSHTHDHAHAATRVRRSARRGMSGRNYACSTFNKHARKCIRLFKFRPEILERRLSARDNPQTHAHKYVGQ